MDSFRTYMVDTPSNKKKTNNKAFTINIIVQSLEMVYRSQFVIFSFPAKRLENDIKNEK